MKQKTTYLVAGAAVLLLLFIPGVAGSVTTASATSLLNVADQLVTQFEGFRSQAYWDVSRWSWGYGTQAPGPGATITESDAFEDMQAVNDNNYLYLSGLITRPLNANQWGALLSFGYNEGEWNADNLVPDINAGNDSILEPHWKQYIYAGGVIDPALVTRRAQEWQVWTS